MARDRLHFCFIGYAQQVDNIEVLAVGGGFSLNVEVNIFCLDGGWAPK